MHFRNGLLVVLAAAAIACLPLSGSQSQGGGDDILNPKRCDVTQLPLRYCPNLVTANFDDGRHEWSMTVAGPIALFKRLEDYSREPETILILDHKQFEAGNQRMIEVGKAWFLYDAKGDPAVSQDPHIYAFRSKKEAEAAQKELGGKLQQWPDVSKQAKEYAAEWEPHGRRVYY